MAGGGSSTRARGSRRRSPDGEGWLYGVHPVVEALRAGRRRLVRLWLREGGTRSEDRQLAGLAEQAGLPVEWVDRAEMEARVGSDVVTQGVLLEAGPLPELSLGELLEHARTRGPGRRLVALDGVEDPQNVGAIARVAEASGALGLILTDRRAPPLSAAVAKSSAGAIEWLRVARVPNLARALGSAQKEGYWTVAAAPGEGESLFEVEDRRLTGDLVVVLGAEGRGLRRGILELADHPIWLPMPGAVDSLNVATAGAVILYDLLRRADEAARD